MGNNEFLKLGSKIIVSPKGLDYSLIPGKVYNLFYDGYNEQAYLEEDGEITLPKKVYQSEKDKLFVKRVINYYKTTDKHTTGILLTGLKGSGKSLAAKNLSLLCGLPIVIVSPNYPASKLNDIFANIKTECCVLFDECDKNERWESNKMLTFLDGVQSTAKKLVIYTCNETCELSDFLMDRCSRIRYLRHYDGLNEDTITMITESMLLDKSKVTEVSSYIFNKFITKSYDNIISFIEELNLLKDENLKLNEIVEDMNIDVK